MNATMLIDSLDRLLSLPWSATRTLRLRSRRGAVTWYRVGSTPFRPTLGEATESALPRAGLEMPAIAPPESQQDLELARCLVWHLRDHPDKVLTLYHGPDGYRVRGLSGARATLREALGEALHDKP